MLASMSAAKSKASAPLTFDLPESLIGKIARAQKGHRLNSASEVVRLALAKFDWDRFKPTSDPHRQLSVRIPGATRKELKRVARLNRASIGELIRAAVEALPEKSALRSRA